MNDLKRCSESPCPSDENKSDGTKSAEYGPAALNDTIPLDLGWRLFDVTVHYNQTNNLALPPLSVFGAFFAYSVLQIGQLLLILFHQFLKNHITLTAEGSMPLKIRPITFN